MIDPSLTQTIRLYCDGELSPDEASQFERKLEGNIKLQQAVVFERELRKHLGDVLTRESPKAPAALLSRIQLAIVEENTPAPLSFDSAKVAQPTWRVSIPAIAAVLLLVVGAVIFGIVFPQIDSLQNDTSSFAGAELLSTIGTAVAVEHDRVAGNKDVAVDKLNLTDPDDMSSELSQHLKGRVTPIDLSSLGYTFFGGARFGGALPCGGPSGHLLFKKKQPDGTWTGPNISLFCVPEENLEAFLSHAARRKWVENERQLAIGDGNLKCRHKVLRLDYPDTGLVYFLVTCDPDMLEPASELVLEQLRAACR